MNIKYVCPFWGCEDTKVDKFLAKAEKRDYQVVEIKISTDAQIEENSKEKLSTNYKPDLVFKQWLLPLGETVNPCINKLEKRLYKLTEFNPAFINSQTARDVYTIAKKSKIHENIFLFEKQTAIPVYHVKVFALINL